MIHMGEIHKVLFACNQGFDCVKEAIQLWMVVAFLCISPGILSPLFGIEHF